MEEGFKNGYKRIMAYSFDQQKYAFFQLRLREPVTKTTTKNIGNDFIQKIKTILNSNPNWQSIDTIATLNFSSKTPIVLEILGSPFLMNVGECKALQKEKEQTRNQIIVYKTNDIWFFYIDLVNKNTGLICDISKWKGRKEYTIHSALLKIKDIVEMVEKVETLTIQ